MQEYISSGPAQNIPSSSLAMLSNDFGAKFFQLRVAHITEGIHFHGSHMPVPARVSRRKKGKKKKKKNGSF